MKRLWTTLRYTYSGMRGQILGWGLGLALYGLMIIPMYDTMAAQQDQLQQMIASYPEEFLAFFGGDASQHSEDERGRLDLIIAHPVGRTSFFFGRSLGLLGATLSIMLLGWLGFSLLLGTSSLGFTWGQMSVPFLSLSVQILVYASLALLLSMLLPSRNLAAMLSGVIVVASYFISSLAFISESLEALSAFMPYHYFQTVLSIQDLNLAWLLALLGASLIMAGISWLRFLRRDIRLSGEGSWRLPISKRRRAAV